MNVIGSRPEFLVMLSLAVIACSSDQLEVGSTDLGDGSAVDARDRSEGEVGQDSQSLDLDDGDASPVDTFTIEDGSGTDALTETDAPEDTPSPVDADSTVDAGAIPDIDDDVGTTLPGDALDADELPATPDVADTGSPTPDVGPSGPMTYTTCFQGQFPPTGVPTVDYDQYAPVVGSHCKGTNHQDIQGVERVVFVGDSITVGTPPTLPTEWYRVLMAKALASKFGLTAPDIAWENVDLVNGVTYAQSSGDFWSCAKWGARTDDLTDMPHQQLITCNPEAERQKRTLIVMTAGGNDLFSWAQDLVKGVPVAELWMEAEKAVQNLEESIHWLVDDEARFPNGVYVVFGNTYEFTDTDSGNDLASCPGANLIGMDTALINPDFTAMATWMAGEYMRIAVETQTDMTFFGELTCGHGHMNDNPEGRCFRGPGTDLWLDITCMHPSAAGHAGIADMFLSTIAE